MHREPFGSVGQDLVLSPGVRNAARENDHPAQHVNFAVQRLMLDPGSRSPFAVEFSDEFGALLRQDFHRIGRQQLVVAERGGDGATVLVIFEPGFDVVTAVSGRFKAVNPHDLVPRQAGGKRRYGVSALKLGLALRKARDEFELLARRCDKIGDHRHIDRSRRNFGLERIARFRRTGIDRRLRQHIIGQGQRLATGALGIAQLPLIRNQRPVRARCRGIALPRLVVFLERMAVVGHGRSGARRLHQGIGGLAGLRRRRRKARRRHRDRQQCGGQIAGLKKRDGTQHVFSRRWFQPGPIFISNSVTQRGRQYVPPSSSDAARFHAAMR